MSEKKVTLSILAYYDERMKEWVLEQIGENAVGTFSFAGVVASDADLSQEGNQIGDVYLVGPQDDGSYAEYVWLEANGEGTGAWEPIGLNSANGGDITREELYAGPNGDHTPGDPFPGTILDQLGIAQLRQDLENGLAAQQNYTDMAVAGVADDVRMKYEELRRDLDNGMAGQQDYTDQKFSELNRELEDGLNGVNTLITDTADNIRFEMNEGYNTLKDAINEVSGNCSTVYIEPSEPVNFDEKDVWLVVTEE